MGLDMYLYKINRKVKNEKEIIILNEILLSGEENLKESFELINAGNDIAYINAPYKHFRKDIIDAYKKAKDMINKNNANKCLFDDLNLTAQNIIDAIKKEQKKDLALYEFLIKNENLCSCNIKEVGYWRKHADFHQMMEDLYYERGGKDIFNCIPLILSKKDIENILETVNDIINDKNEVKKGSGFFWGETLDSDWKKTKEIFENILAITDFDNETIYYDSWW